MLTALLILYVGAQLVIAGETTISALIAGSILATRALSPLRLVVVAWVPVQEVRAASSGSTRSWRSRSRRRPATAPPRRA